MVTPEGAAKPLPLGPIQELAETINLIIISSPGEDLKFAFEVFEPWGVIRQVDDPLLDRSAGCVEADFLVMLGFN